MASPRLKKLSVEISGMTWELQALPGGLAFDYRPLILSLFASFAEGSQSGEIGAARSLLQRLDAATMRLLRGVLLEEPFARVVLPASGEEGSKDKRLSGNLALDGGFVDHEDAMEALVHAVSLSFGPFGGSAERFRRLAVVLSSASKTSAEAGPSSG